MTAESPVPDYKSFADVVHEVRDVYVFDLVRYAVRLPSDYLSCLEPEPLGVYTRAALEPLVIFNPDIPFYSLSQYKRDRLNPDITSYQKFIETTEPIVNYKGEVVCISPSRMRNLFQPKCSFHYSAIHLAAVAAWDVLRSLHRDTEPMTTMPRHWLDERHWVLPDCKDVFDAASNSDLGYMVDKLYDFIGRDVCSVYSLNMQNTTLVVEKGNDFRIIEYYRQIFDQHEADRFVKYGY